MSPPDGATLLDQAARTHLNMSGEEFLRLWDRGYFSTLVCRDRNVAMVARLIPMARPNAYGNANAT